MIFNIKYFTLLYINKKTSHIIKFLTCFLIDDNRIQRNPLSRIFMPTSVERALVYVSENEQFLVGAALLTPEYALSLARFFKNYIGDDIPTSNLSVGTDEPFLVYREFNHHLVEKVVGDGCGETHSLAIITVSTF